MAAMTMTYSALDPKEFEGIVAGDLINATLSSSSRRRRIWCR